jgi:hypothetical protein
MAHQVDVETVVRTGKEFIRHVLCRMGMQRRRQHLVPLGRAERFSKIYSDGVWRHGDLSVPGSGGGSTLGATTAIRKQLPTLLNDLSCKTFVDVGCGDFTWMQEVELECDYVGVDIVPAVISENIARHGSRRRRFLAVDATCDALPEGDVVLCREMLFHLSLKDVRLVLENILSSPRRYLLLTTDEKTLFNSDIATGDFRILNLMRTPFNLPAPQLFIDDAAMAPGRRIGVWQADAVRKVL